MFPIAVLRYCLNVKKDMAQIISEKPGQFCSGKLDPADNIPELMEAAGKYIWLRGFLSTPEQQKYA